MANTNIKPFKLYAKGASPNPWKVVFILEELGLPYTLSQVLDEQLKTEPFISVNPNGRVPALTDPNQGNLTLFESGAIIDYLIAEYDPDHLLQYTTSPEKHITRSWEHFQMSGQGPYFGQLAWFIIYHPEKVQSAIDRYSKEVERVTSVIDTHLKKTGSPYLVGDKVTYADLMWLPWILVAGHVFAHVDLSQFTAYNAWYSRLQQRPAVARVVGMIEDEMVKRAAAPAPEKAAN